MSALHALLIGVSDYAPNRLPDGLACPNLEGAVLDIERVERFLCGEYHLPPERITKLTASANSPDTGEPAEHRPTYENMVAAFQKVTSAADPGDQIYIHYSGHGQRIPTGFPELKGTHGWDECLVPCNICDPAARYLRDVEIAALLHAMVSRHLLVTLMLDSCHAGGATRGRTVAVARSLPHPDRVPRPMESGVASREHLVEVWRRSKHPVTRSLLPKNWLPATEDYVCFAACHPRERAVETRLEGERRGVFTYWLLDTLRREGTDLTCRQLHSFLVARVHGQEPNQTPMLLGDGERLFLRAERRQSRDSVLVVRRDDKKRRILLNTGRTQGVREGEQFAIYPPRADLMQDDQRQAIVEIRQVGATESWSEVIQEILPGPIEPGGQGVLIGAGSLPLQKSVAIVPNPLLASQEGDLALASVRRALAAQVTGFVRLAAEGEAPDFQVAAHEEKLEVWDSNGEPIPNLYPALAVSNQSSIPKLIQRLEHLARFQTIRQLENLKPDESLRGFQVRFLNDPADPCGPPGGIADLSIGGKVRVEIFNGTSRTLHVAVLDLSPDWAIEQIWPPVGDVSDTSPLEPGERKSLPVRADLPHAYSEGQDVFKVFAAVGTTNFRWLRLLPLDERIARRSGGPKGILGELFAMLSAGTPPKRNLTPSAFPDEGWITHQLTIRIHR